MADNAKILIDIQLNQQQIAAVNQQLASLQQNAVKAQVAGQQAATGIRDRLIGGSSFRSIGQQLRAIPGGGIPETLGRLSPIADVIADIADGAPGASKGLLAFTAGLVAVGFAAQIVVGRINDMTAAVKAETKARYEAQRTGILASDQVNRDRIAQIERETAAVKATLARGEAEISVARERLNESFIATVTRTSDFSTPNILGAITEERGLTAEYDEQRKKAEDLRIEHEELTRVLAEGSNAAAQARAELTTGIEIQSSTAEERKKEIDAIDLTINSINALYLAGQLTEDQQAIALTQLDELIVRRGLLNEAENTAGDLIERNRLRIEASNERIQFSIRLQEMDTDKRGERIAEIQRELAIREEEIEWLKFFGASTEESAAAIERLNSELEILQVTASTNADVLNYANGLQDNINDSTDAYFNNLERQTEEAAKASERWMNAQRDNAQELIDIQREADAKMADVLLEREDRLDKLRYEYDKRREKEEQEHAKRIAKIQRDANNDILDAIGNRDALAAFLAQRKAAEDIADAEEARKEQLDQLRESYEDQVTEVAIWLEKQEREIKQAADRAREIQARRFAEEQRQYQLFQQQQIANTSNNLTQLAAIQISGMQNSLFRTNNFYMTSLSIQDAYQNAALFRLQAFWSGVLGVFSTSPGRISGGGGAGIDQITPFSARGGLQGFVEQATYRTIANMADRSGFTQLTGRR